MSTQTVEEAMALLERYKADRIAVAGEIADELIRRNGSTYTTQVHDEMKARGLIQEGEKMHFLSALFRRRKYRWTGEFALGICSGESKGGPTPCRVWTHAKEVNT